MSEKYAFIQRSNVIYELNGRGEDKDEFYRRFIVFDPINKNYIIPDFKYYPDDLLFAFEYIDNKKTSEKSLVTSESL